MALFSLRNFKTEVARRNLARSTRFEVFLPVPPALREAFNTEQNKLVSLFCESTAFPPQIIGVKQQRIYGPVYQRPFGVEYGGEGLPMSFLLDQQMDVKAFFDAWISKVVDPKQFFVYYPEQYTVDMVLYQLNEKNNTTYTITVEQAFPRSVSLVELNHANQNQVSRLNVTFAYRKWRPDHVLMNRMRYPPVFGNNLDPRVEVYPVSSWAGSTSTLEPTARPEGEIGARLPGGGYTLIPGTTLED